MQRELSSDELQKQLCKTLDNLTATKNLADWVGILQTLKQPGLFKANGLPRYLDAYLPTLEKNLTSSELKYFIDYQLKYVKALWIMMYLYNDYPALISGTSAGSLNDFKKLIYFCAQKTEKIRNMLKQKIEVNIEAAQKSSKRLKTKHR